MGKKINKSDTGMFLFFNQKKVSSEIDKLIICNCNIMQHFPGMFSFGKEQKMHNMYLVT